MNLQLGYLVKSLISRNFLSKTVIQKFRKLHTVHSAVHTVEKCKIYSHQIFFPSNQLFSDLFSKCIAFTKFLQKKPESKFP